MIELGILGSGVMLQWHLHGITGNEGIRVAAIASRNSETGFAAAESLGANYYKTHTEMFQKERLDGIVVLLPNYLHADVCSDAIDAGIKFILCEKTLGNDLDRSKELVEKVLSNDTQLQVGYMKRFNPGFMKVKEILGFIEPVQFVSFTTTESGSANQVSQRDASPWKTDLIMSGGGNLTNVGSHNIDLIRFLFGEAYAVSCKLRFDSQNDLEYYANGRLFMESGIDVDLRIGRVDVPDLGPDWEPFTGGWNETLEIIGDGGYVRVANSTWEGFGPIKATYWLKGMPGPTIEYFDSKQQWVNEMANFAESIRCGKLMPDATTAEDALKVDNIVRHMRRSNENNGEVLKINF